MRRQKEQKIHSKKRIWVVPVLLSAALLETIAVYADEEQTKAAESETSTDLQPGDKGYWVSQETDKITGTDFVTIAESDNMELLIKPKSGTIRWMDKKTGAYKDTNLSADENLAKITDAEKSDLTVSYFNGKYSELYSTYSTYNSFTMCADLGQLSYQYIDDGVRILYTLGDNAMTYKNFPQDISDERMNEFVLQYLSQAEIENLKKTYYSQLSTGDWHRLSNKDKTLGKLQVKELYAMFYETGAYTEEELFKDLEAYEVDESEYPSNLTIVVPVEYYLDGDELVVNVDTSAIETDEESPIMSLGLLPYFLTSATDVEYDDGYMFIPDGSGALINLDSTKVKEYHYSASWYGGDRLINSTTYNSVNPQMMMPVFGMKTSDSTVLAIIENGAEAATLDAYIANTDNSEPFCKMKLTFGIQPQQKVASDSNSSYSVSKASTDVYDENITLRYYWLGEDADYVDMAKCYNTYLVEQGELTAEEPEESTPFFTEVLGTTDKTQYFLGIPYQGKQTLTSFSEAKQLLDDLNTAGIENIKLIYSGMTGGGMNQRALTGGVSIASGLGSNSDFKKLTTYAELIGAEIYPNLLLQSAYTKKGLSGDRVSWNIVNNRAQLYTFDPVTLKVDEEADYKLYMINPNYLDSYLQKIKESFTKKLGINTLASLDLLNFISTNYKGTQVSMSTGEEICMDAAKSMSENMKLMLSNPISDAYAYSSSLTDIPTQDSGMRILDASIPFMQLVLDGYKTYSGESLNLETTDIRRQMIQAIESRSALKFTFTYRDSSLLNKTEQQDLFAVDYSYWKDLIPEIYAEYERFYEQVKDASIVAHELFEKDDNLRIITYSNGVKVYINYSDEPAVIDGVSVEALDYQIKK